MKRKSVTVTKEYDENGKIKSETTETIEEEDTAIMGGIYPYQVSNPYTSYGDHSSGGGGSCPKVTIDGTEIAKAIAKKPILFRQ